MRTLPLVSFVLFAPSLFTQRAEAHYWPWHHPRCEYPESSSSVLEQDIASLQGGCTEVPLQLVRTPWQGQTVDSWQGGYERKVIMHTTYRIDHLDPCSGNVLWSESKEGNLPQTVSFNIENPNLDPDVPSYVANAPLTQAEAQAEMVVPKATCEALKPGPWSDAN